MEFVDLKELSGHKLVVEVSFSKENNKKQKLLRKELSFEKVEEELAKRFKEEGFYN